MAVKEYSYKDVPTIKLMNRDLSYITAIMGPFGSGKSSGCVIKLYERSLAQLPGPDGVCRTKWAIVRNCYDDTTEILTEKRGWQLFKNIIPEDKVATIQRDEIIFEKPQGISVYPYHGEMIGFEGEGVDFLVTPDHKLWISKRRTRKKIWGEFEQIEAQDVYGNTLVRMKKNASWNSPNHVLFNNDIMEYIGFWFAEGSYHKKNGSIITHNPSRYVDDLFNRSGLKHKVSNHRPCRQYKLINDSDISKNIINIFSKAGGSTNRIIPLDIMSSSAENLKSFIAGFTRGDGSINNRDGTIKLYTSSKTMADQLQEIIIKLGSGANILQRNRIGMGVNINGYVGKINTIEYTVSILSNKKLSPVLRRDNIHPNRYKGWYKQEYHGNVYCAIMDFPVVMVRRNGKTSINTRTYPMLRDTTIPTTHEWLLTLGEWHKTDYNLVINKVKSPSGYPVEAIFAFRALDKPDDIRNLLSAEYTGAWFNEAREIPKRIVDAMRGRIGRYPKKDLKAGFQGATWTGIIMDTNPPDTDHWFYKFFEEDKPQYCSKCRDKQGGVILLLKDVGTCPKCGGKDGIPFAKIYKQPSGRGPVAENLPNLPMGYYSNIIAGMDKDFIRVYADGEYGYVSDGKPVYTMFDDDKHVAKEILKANPQYPIIIGFDNTGLDQAAIICQYLPSGQLRVLHEFIITDTCTRDLVRSVVKPFVTSTYFGADLILTGDPAGVRKSDTDERTTFQEIAEAFNVIPTPAHSNSLSARLGSVNSLMRKYLGQNQYGMLVSPACKTIIKGFRGEYRMRRLQVVGKDMFHDRPEKNLVSHGHDALQYACMMVEDAPEELSQLAYRPTGSSAIVTPGNWNAFI